MDSVELNAVVLKSGLGTANHRNVWFAFSSQYIPMPITQAGHISGWCTPQRARDEPVVLRLLLGRILRRIEASTQSIGSHTTVVVATCCSKLRRAVWIACL